MLGSDHLPVLTTLDERPVIEYIGAPRWKLKRKNWDLFISHLDDLNEQRDAEHTAEVRAAGGGDQRGGGGVYLQAEADDQAPAGTETCTSAVKLRNAARLRAHRHRFREDAAEQQAMYLKGEAQSTIREAGRELGVLLDSSLRDEAVLRV